MPYYDPYQAAPAIQQYMQQDQPAQFRGMPVQGMPMQQMPVQGSSFQGAQVPGTSVQGMAAQSMPTQGMQIPGMPGMADIQQYIYPANLQEAIQLISGAVAGEREDRLFYEYLIGTAPSEEDKDIIRGIRDNEITHFSLFRLIYFQLTGQMPPPPQEIPFVRPSSYCEGLRKALLGEENAVTRYRKILFAMQYRVHINMIVEIITDELRHGTLYSYLYAKNGCRV